MGWSLWKDMISNKLIYIEVPQERQICFLLLEGHLAKTGWLLAQFSAQGDRAGFVF